jgi:hypothetical protein
VVPSSGSQLLIVLLFIIPGSVFQACRGRLRGPSPADRDATSRIVRAIAVSTLLNAAYLAALGGSLNDAVQDIDKRAAAGFSRNDGWVLLLLLFVVPASLALADFFSISLRDRLFLKLRVFYDPTPRSWDFAFSRKDPCFVRILTGDDRWVGGWFSSSSFAASYPEPLEIYLERAWRLDEHGGFLEEQVPSAGIWVRCDDARVVEFIPDA